MQDESSDRWGWWIAVLPCLVVVLLYRGQITNSLRPRVSPETAIQEALGADVRLEGPVRIRPRNLGKRGHRMAFGRVVICGRAVSATRTTPVAVVYPLRTSSRSPSVVTPDNLDGSQNEGAFIGRAVLAKCARRAMRDARPF